jgi:hypothetical protein
MFDSLYFDLIVTIVALRFQALKEKEDLLVEDAPAETTFGDHRKIVVDVDVAKIANENLTTSKGQDVAEAVAGVTPDSAEQEKRAEV